MTNSLSRFFVNSLLLAGLLFAGNATSATDKSHAADNTHAENKSQAKASGPAVLVQYNKQYYGFMTLPRLSEVVAPAATAPALYWPAGRLYHTDAAQVVELEQTRQQLLQQLNALQQRYLQQQEPELAASVGHLKQQIGSWVLAKQQWMLLDPDVVRIKPELNPKLLPGQYLLQVTGRPTSLAISGLVKNQQLPFRNVTDAADYMQDIDYLYGASKSFLYILPAGKPVMLAKTGLWNRQRQEIPPGAMIFVPFEQRLLPGGFTELNQQIVALLQHRVI